MTVAGDQGDVRRRSLGPLYEDLRQASVAAVERFSRNSWVDFNVHDPGITILEYLCWALTDVGFRASHDIADLLAPEDPSGTDGAGASGLDRGPSRSPNYPARQILPVRPVTVRDWRKLVIGVPGVENAWMTRRTGPIGVLYDPKTRALTLDGSLPRVEEIGLRGYWDVQVQLAADAAAGAVLAQVRDRLLANRNLCEDFVCVDEVGADAIGVCADLQVADDVDVVDVQARVVHALEGFIAPVLRFHTLEEMLDAGDTIDRAFTGPELARGFLIDAEVDAAERRGELHVSDLIRVMMEVDGVEAVRRISVTRFDDSGAALASTGFSSLAGDAPDSDLRKRWVLPLDPTRVDRLQVEKNRLRFFKGLVPFSVAADDPRFLERLAELRATDRPRAAPADRLDPRPPAGQNRFVGAFRSVQNRFPRNYGVGRGTLPASADVRRRAQAYQLKAFLTLFDQVVANELAQLRALPHLFSLDPQVRTYFTQPVNDVDDLETLLVGAAQYGEWLQEISESSRTFHARRNRILDHLLARFAERFGDMDIARDVEGRRGPEVEVERIEAKRQFLLAYPAISRHRFAGFDYGQGPGARVVDERVTAVAPDRSGLALRMELLLGLGDNAWSRPDPNGALRGFELYEEHDQDGEVEWRFRWSTEEPGVELSSSRRYLDLDELWDEVRAVLMLARDAANYDRRRAEDNTYYYNVVDASGAVVARRIRFFATAAERDDAITASVAWFRGLPPWERCWVLEHQLLRPRIDDPAAVELLPVCSDEEPDVPGFDPYSFRITVALPAWLARFERLDYRRFVETMVREQAPSHVFVKICWIEPQTARDLEAAIEPWLSKLAEVVPGQLLDCRGDHDGLVGLQALQNEVVKVWRGMRSQFPPARLHDCTAEDGQPLVLDNTKLGSAEEKNP